MRICTICHKERPDKRFRAITSLKCKNCVEKARPGFKAARKRHDSTPAAKIADKIWRDRPIPKAKHRITTAAWRKTAPGRVYKSLAAARSRCNNPKDANYHNYGAKGIKFLLTGPQRAIAKAILIPQYQVLLGQGKIPSINRIDPKGHYEIGNIEGMDQKLNANYGKP